MSGYTYLKRGSAYKFSNDSDDENESCSQEENKRSIYLDISESVNKSPVNEIKECAEKRRALQSKILESSQRSLGLLRNSEEGAVSTAKELLVQREQLERVDQGLDKMGTTLKETAKDIRGVKSVFGVFKNFINTKRERIWSKKWKSSCTTHPDFPEALANELKFQEKRSSSENSGLKRVGVTLKSDGTFEDSMDFEKQLTDNLEELNSSVAKLRDLALGIGEEVDCQNKLIDNITCKTETTMITLQTQNKDMKKLLE